MATTYSWKINALDTYPTKDSLVDVVYSVHYSYIATSDQKDSNNEFYSFEIIGTVNIEEPDGNSFTAFADLTESKVVNWIETKLDMSVLKDSVDAKLAGLIIPVSVTKNVPW